MQDQQAIIVQYMIEWIEEHLNQDSILGQLSQEVGYSPWYCSTVFHDIAGMTLRSYVSGRRLARATADIRDTGERLLDIALKYGYTSQEALSRAFKDRYGCTPAAYRRNPLPIPMAIQKRVLFPDCISDVRTGSDLNLYFKKKLESKCKNEWRLHMDKEKLSIRVEHIPAHKYLGIWEENAENYGSFWKYHPCDEVCGYIDSMEKMAHPIVTAHTAGWKIIGTKRIYFYGLGVPSDYDGKIPDGFEIRDIPASDYLVFAYPVFDYLKENLEVIPAVEKLAWEYDPSGMGYAWNDEACQIYQRHFPEKLGYQVLRPVRKV